MTVRLGLVLGLFAQSSTARAQGLGLLPQGVGLYQLGYRLMPDLDSKFDQTTAPVPLGRNFDKEFKGPEMLKGRLGQDLKKLSTILVEFEGGAGGPGTLAGDLDLGKLSGDVTANVNSTILAMGFGVTKYLTVFVGLPIVSAEVTTQLSLTGPNNAQATLDKVGAAAFDELRDGLVRASNLSTDEIKKNFEEFGYKPVDKWSNSGLGDLRIGAKTGVETILQDGTNYSASVVARVEIPTGYIERADTLTDISFGKGYYALGLTLDQNLSRPSFFLGMDGTFLLNLDSDVEKRVPEAQETTMAKERTATVHLNPGDEIDFGGYVGTVHGWFSPRYRLGFARHFSDRYSGDLVGNYAELSKESDSWRLIHEAALILDSSKAYRAGKFSFPFVIAFKTSVITNGLNTSEQKFYELSFASFFSTPLAEKRPPPAKNRVPAEN